MSGGLRYADYDEFSLGDTESMEDSLGPVLGLEMTRPLNACWSIFAVGRGSIQFAGEGLDNDDPENDLTFTIAELQLGV